MTNHINEPISTAIENGTGFWFAAITGVINPIHQTTVNGLKVDI
ncbi:hypothetical protein SAMN05216498_0804 [Tenuibacillus multivorans]|uniref:Uncharacterized protein n=1 Tax=Tenuibacillus multivorans TaxID=237069 RepID=A0A1G9WM29_9BACI|nr:hypothetical protein SAMN05216498_0804 [Tenuibacillus multivorans]